MDDFIALNDAFKRNWSSWYRNSPASYKLPIFANATPLSIIIMYGQNRIVSRPPGHAIDSAFWRKDMDPLKFSRIEFALATHYSYVFVICCSTVV